MVSVVLLVLALPVSTRAASVTLAWDPSGDPAVGGYQVYYGSVSGAYTNKVDAGNSTSLTINNLSGGGSYYFAATTYNVAGLESDFSTEVSVTLPAPLVTFSVAAQSSRVNAGSVAGGGNFTNGSGVTLVATPATGFTFVNWTENGTVLSSDTSYSFTVSTNRNVVGNFRGPNTQSDLDFNGDGKADLTVYDPSAGNWYVKLAGDYFSSGFGKGATFGQKWGWTGAKTLRGDFDGDGKTDLTVYDPGSGDWYVWFSSGSSAKVHWGWVSAIPITGDFNGDGRTDFGVYDRSSGTWYIKCSGTNRASFASGASFAVVWGDTNSIPLCGDFDGDRTSDLVSYTQQTGDWRIRFSSGGSATLKWGWAGALPLPGDYNGDGRTDLAAYDPNSGVWYIKYSGGSTAQFGSGATTSASWGWKGTVPIPGDYDGDGISDLAVFYPAAGDYYIRFSRGSSIQVHWGWNGAGLP